MIKCIILCRGCLKDVKVIGRRVVFCWSYFLLSFFMNRVDFFRLRNLFKKWRV